MLKITWGIYPQHSAPWTSDQDHVPLISGWAHWRDLSLCCKSGLAKMRVRNRQVRSCSRRKAERLAEHLAEVCGLPYAHAARIRYTKGAASRADHCRAQMMVPAFVAKSIGLQEAWCWFDLEHFTMSYKNWQFFSRVTAGMSARNAASARTTFTP